MPSQLFPKALVPSISPYVSASLSVLLKIRLDIFSCFIHLKTSGCSMWVISKALKGKNRSRTKGSTEGWKGWIRGGKPGMLGMGKRGKRQTCQVHKTNKQKL